MKIEREEAFLYELDERCAWNGLPLNRWSPEQDEI